MAAPLVLVGAEQGWIALVTRVGYTAEFAHGADIAERQSLASILECLHLDSEKIFSRIGNTQIEDGLKRQTAGAQARGIFGPASFPVGEALFWGDDRLTEAPAWVRRG